MREAWLHAFRIVAFYMRQGYDDGNDAVGNKNKRVSVPDNNKLLSRKPSRAAPRPNNLYNKHRHSVSEAATPIRGGKANGGGVASNRVVVVADVCAAAASASNGAGGGVATHVSNGARPKVRRSVDDSGIVAAAASSGERKVRLPAHHCHLFTPGEMTGIF